MFNRPIGKFSKKKSNTLRKHANAVYTDFFSIKNNGFFFIILICLLKTLIVGTSYNRLAEAGSYEYTQSMFWIKNKKKKSL